MYIIIVGSGRTGYYLLKGLLKEGHEVLLLEKNATICENIIEEMGSVCYHGDGCEVATLAEVGTSRADMLVAVTGDDEDNLVACQIAKYKFNVPRTIARVRNPQNENLFRDLGVDVIVNSTSLILEAIEKEVPTHSITHLLTLRDEGLEIIHIKITAEATTIGKTIRDLAVPKESTLVLLIPVKEKPCIPTLNSVISEGDHIIALTPPESENNLLSALRGF